eukprot:snap_masked-scaffold156_size297567-processed-gene-1.4 protein:Tk07674 transcript:snap_masked-scaffold156_size297567-processed-gene-1.4-mRNA-1 annotation:"e3 ubiquitin-protein ligase sh3rf1-like"
MAWTGPNGPDMGELGDLLECSVCLETLGHNHKVLPCQHTFCAPCISDVYKKKPSHFLCPECRTPCRVPLEQLPANVILNRILEGMGAAGRRHSRSSMNSESATPNRVSGNPQTNPFLQMLNPSSPSLWSAPANLSFTTPTSMGLDMSATPSPQSPVPTLPPKPGLLPGPSSAPIVPARPHSALTPASGRGSPAGHQLYRALYNYKALKHDELELVKDELYIVTLKCRDGWYKGSSIQSLKTGVFPGNYVQHVKHDSLDSEEKSPMAKSIPQLNGGRTALPVSSDLIDLTHDMSSLFRTTSTIVPPNVTPNWGFPKASSDSSLATPPRAQLPPPPSIPKERYRCTMAYPASSQYELDLKEGDVVILFKRRDDGWAKGSLETNPRRTGLFPMNFVQKM